MGLRIGPREIVKVEEAEAELPARSEAETETVWEPWAKSKEGVKLKPVAVMVAREVTSAPSREILTEARLIPKLSLH
jgi:hypothetical protein